MDNIIKINISKSSLNNIDIKQYQIIYCNDTKECYYDIDNNHRIQLGCTIQIENDIDRKNISIPLRNKLYIVLENDKLYRYKKEWYEVTTNTQILDIVSSAQELIPVTLSKNKKRYAPKTTSRNVYMSDGRNVEEALKDLKDKTTKSLIFTRTEFVVAKHNYQKIFDIPFPISNYDLKRFPIIIIGHGRLINTDEYTLTSNQMITKSEEFMKDEIVTFIFNYSVKMDDNIINSTHINNIRFFVGQNKRNDLEESDVWIDTSNKTINQMINGELYPIVDTKIKERSIDENKLSNSVVKKINGNNDKTIIIEKVTNEIKKEIENLYNKIDNGSCSFKQETYILKTNTNTIRIPSSFNFNEKDTLFVFKNSIFTNYKLSKNKKNIICLNNEIWMGAEEPITFNLICFKGL